MSREGWPPDEQLFSLWRLLLVGMLGSHRFKAVLTVMTSLCPGVVVGGYLETSSRFPYLL